MTALALLALLALLVLMVASCGLWFRYILLRPVDDDVEHLVRPRARHHHMCHAVELAAESRVIEFDEGRRTDFAAGLAFSTTALASGIAF